MSESFQVNQARWDEVVAIHLRSPFYRVREFLAGADTLTPIESAEIGPVAGKRLVHLQCHIGLDTLSLARRGAQATGFDFSPKALGAARDLATRAGLAARFVEGNLYDAPALLGASYDIAYVNWGAINWLPDIRGWAKVVAAVLEPGGFLYMIEGHPCALALEQPEAEGPIEPTYPYFHGREPLVFHADTTYTGEAIPVRNTEMHEWIHPLGAIVTALLEAGLVLEFLHEHDSLAWKLFSCMEEGSDRLFRLPPGRPSLPLAVSLRARKPG